ncbi:hypothetical protein TNCV_4747291 [Trichonephila clavipes]|nr:hypothetical protein TNCV_4747291 [Trichonephila clavipes]
MSEDRDSILFEYAADHAWLIKIPFPKHTLHLLLWPPHCTDEVSEDVYRLRLPNNAAHAADRTRPKKSRRVFKSPDEEFITF